MKNYDVLNELVPKTQELHRAIFDKGYEQGQKDILEQQSCADTISRQEAIKLIQKYGVGCFDAEEFSPEQCERFVISKLNSLPPVTPKEKTGQWIAETTSNYNGRFTTCYCSNCKDYFTRDWEKMNYCPNCGARMINRKE